MNSKIENSFSPKQINEQTKREMWKLVETFIYSIFLTEEYI